MKHALILSVLWRCINPNKYLFMSYPIMNNIIHDLFNFIQNIESNTLNIDVDVLKYKKIQKYVAGNTSFYADDVEEQSQELREGLGIELSENQKELFFIDVSEFHWDRGEQISAEGTLAGGFFINGITEMLLEPNNFWKDIADKFQEANQEDKVEIPEGFSWLTGTHAVNSSRRLCHYGCVKPAQGKFPSEFFFYDSGLPRPAGFTIISFAF